MNLNSRKSLLQSVLFLSIAITILPIPTSFAAASSTENPCDIDQFQSPKELLNHAYVAVVAGDLNCAIICATELLRHDQVDANTRSAAWKIVINAHQQLRHTIEAHEAMISRLKEVRDLVAKDELPTFTLVEAVTELAHDLNRNSKDAKSAFALHGELLRAPIRERLDRYTLAGAFLNQISFALDAGERDAQRTLSSEYRNLFPLDKLGGNFDTIDTHLGVLQAQFGVNQPNPSDRSKGLSDPAYAAGLMELWRRPELIENELTMTIAVSLDEALRASGQRNVADAVCSEALTIYDAKNLEWRKSPNANSIGIDSLYISICSTIEGWADSPRRPDLKKAIIERQLAHFKARNDTDNVTNCLNKLDHMAKFPLPADPFEQNSPAKTHK